VILATLFVLVGCTSLQNAIAQGDTRTLSFTHTHRDDSITVTFKRNGRYDEDGLKKLNWFLRDWRTDEQTTMARELFDILWEVYREVGAKEPIHIVSSYRAPATNAMLRRRSHGVAQFSQHMLGKAIDFFIPGVPLEQLRYAGLRLQRGGVGFYPTSGSPFVHVDIGGVRHWPRMTHDQLVKIFPDGKTVHIPADGHPLKNYELALADVQRRGSTLGGASLTAARNAGIRVADGGSAGPGRERDFLSKLLGIGQDDDEDKEPAAPRGRPAAGPQPAAGGQQVAAAEAPAAPVPMPRVRPAIGGAAAGEFTLASASSTPAKETSSPPPAATPAAAAPADTAPTASDVIDARGFWPSNGAPAAQPERQPAVAAAAVTLAEAEPPPSLRQAISPTGERLAWSVGPDPAAPRPPRDIEGAPANAADVTASVSAWTNDPAQNDRVPRDVALAYAAQHADAPAAATPAKAAPMGSLRPDNATVAAKKPAANSPAAKIVQRNADPWLRSVVMTPSVHYSLSVTVLGSPDYRTLRPLMHKPRTTVAMVFSNDPQLGITSARFSGPAISFLPTISHVTRTAGLN